MTSFGSFPNIKSTNPSSSMGTSRRFGTPKPTPGPGAYMGQTLSESQFNSSASLPFGSKTRSAKTAEKGPSYSPARSTFGQQTASVISSSPASSFGLARRPLKPLGPGPAAYPGAEVSSFSRSMERRERSFGSEQRFNLAEDDTPGPHSPGFSSVGPRPLSDYPQPPSFSFAGKSSEAMLILGDQASKWRAQGVHGRQSKGPLSHDPPMTGKEMGCAPMASLKGRYATPKPRLEPHAQTYTPLSLYWDGRQALGKSASQPASLLNSRSALKPV